LRVDHAEGEQRGEVKLEFEVKGDASGAGGEEQTTKWELKTWWPDWWPKGNEDE
jgi:hypothetical protein